MDEPIEASEGKVSEVEGDETQRSAPASGLLKHWRWFAMEFSVVALGVLTALGAEQAISTYHANGKAATAQESLNDELRENRILAAGFAATLRCTDRQLTVISNAIGENDQEHLRRLIAATQLAPPRPWSDAAWQSVLASDVIDRFDEEKRLSYSGSYYVLGRLRGYQERAVDAWWRLEALTRNTASSSANLAEAQTLELAELSAAISGIESVVLLMNTEQQNSIFEQLDPNSAPITEDPSDPGMLGCEAAADTLETMSAET